MSAVKVSVVGVEPDDGLAVNQGASSVTLKAALDESEVVNAIVVVWLVPPTVAVIVADVGLATRAG
jgi:hypothetical protein